MEKTVVKMMSTFQVEVEVDIPGTVIRCHLRTVHRVYYRSLKSAAVRCCPLQPSFCYAPGSM